MTIFTSPLENTNGTTLTTSNAGGTAFTSITGTATYTNAAAAHGTTALSVVAAGPAQWWTITGTTLLARGYLYLISTPGSDTTVAQIFCVAGTTKAAQLVINSAGKFKLQRGSASTVIWTATSAITTGTWVRWELYVDSGTSAVTGNLRFAYYATKDSLTFTEDTGVGAGFSNVDVAGTTGALSQVRFNESNLFYVDDFGAKTSTDAVWGAWSANVAPTQALTANQNVAASASVSATTTPTDDGTISSYLWSYVSASSTGSPSLSGSTTATTSFTASTAGNLYTLQSLITDDGGLTATNTTEVRVPITGATTGVPLALNGTNVVGTMTNTGGAGTDGAALADASDSTYIESGTVNGTEQSERYRWQPSASRAAADVVLRLGTDTGTANVAVRLYEGTTLRQSWAQAVTSTATNYTFSLSGGTISAISDWGNLFLEWGATT